jgi:very-short-patch-repair endonuclease
VSHEQLLGLGVSPEAIQRRVRAGRLLPWYRGVYAVGHVALGVEGRRRAAALGCGAGTVLSHISAADAFEIRTSSSALVHVTVRGRAGRKRHAGIRIHRPRALADDEITALRGLPVTTPARTILDLAAAGLPDRQLEAALNIAERRRLLDFNELRNLLARYPRRHGTRSLKAQLSRFGGPVDTRSELERLVYELSDDRRLPRPLVNTVIEGRVRDFHWPLCRLVVEADSYRWHRSPSALNDDRERDVELTLAGFRVLRFTWEQVTDRPDYVVRAILSALGAL